MNANSETLQSTSEQRQPITSVTVLGARLTWVIFGPLALILLTWGIVSRGGGWITFLDFLFVIAVGWALLGRWIEQRSGAATLITGAPATLRHFRRYVTALLTVAAVAWVTANFLGNHILVSA